jgi:hypothetical protein
MMRGGTVAAVVKPARCVSGNGTMAVEERYGSVVALEVAERGITVYIFRLATDRLSASPRPTFISLMVRAP